MAKKIILSALIISIISIWIGCTASITAPNENEETGDGNLIKPEIAITDEATINNFINQHNGIYYSTYDDGSLTMRYIIEGSDIYSGYGTKIDAIRTLFGSKLQLYIAGKTSGGSAGYERNDEMYTFNFGIDGNIYLFANAIFHKENYSEKNGYTYKIGEPINNLIAETGNYYYYDYDNTQKYYILIDGSGQVYIDENFNITYSKDYFENSILTIIYTQSGGTRNKQNLHFYKDKLIFGNTWINDQLQYEKLSRYGLFSPYAGTYKSSDSSITLNVTPINATITGVSGTPVMTGNTLIIYQYSSRYPTKEHKFVFSEDKNSCTYTKPDGSKITLQK